MRLAGGGKRQAVCYRPGRFVTLKWQSRDLGSCDEAVQRHRDCGDDLSHEYGADKNTISLAISEVLGPEGLAWAVPKRGTIVRHGIARPHRILACPGC
jgi:hypothetical protein